MAKIKRQPDIEKIIKKAVEAGIKAGRVQAERTPDNTYKATERRLYALPVLVRKVEDARLRLEELEEKGAPGRSKDVIRFARAGVRVSPEEILEALIVDIKASIAADEHEIETMRKALQLIEDDTYYPAVKGKYIEGLSDEKIAAAVSCDPSTVRRNRGRLVRILAVWLYGTEAV
jgi:hypothetical protein